VAFILSHLSGKALKWATAILSPDLEISSDYSSFLREFRFVFDYPADGLDAATQLHSISQGVLSVPDYTLNFRILAAESGWGDRALQSAFRRGLSESIKDGIMRDRPGSLNELIEVALMMDQRLAERRCERVSRTSSPIYRPSRHLVDSVRSQRPPTSPPQAQAEEEPMQVGRSRLSIPERDQRFRDRLCLYCGQAGHFVRTCPNRPQWLKDQAR